MMLEHIQRQREKKLQVENGIALVLIYSEKEDWRQRYIVKTWRRRSTAVDAKDIYFSGERIPPHAAECNNTTVQ